MSDVAARSGIRRVNRGRNHSYTIDGHKAIGVTTAISKGIPKPALPNWSAKRVAEFVADNPEQVESLRGYGRDGLVNALKGVPWSERDAAAARGTEVHIIAEKLIRGERVDVPEELAGHVGSAVAFMDEWGPVPVIAERVVGHRQWGYCGTFDLVADIRGERWLLDYKTSKSGIFGETALQLAAYRYAESYVADDIEIPMSEVGIERCGAVWIRADGYDLIPVQADEAVFKVFLHALVIARNTDAMKTWVGEAMYP